MPNHLAELKKLCKSAPSSRDQELVETGDTMWLMGRPVSSDDGMIAIAQTDDLHLIVRERDIIEVDRTKDVAGSEDLFLVKVRSEANVIVRFQKVVKAVPQGCGCEYSGEKETAPSMMLQQQQGDTGPFGVPLGPCRLFTYCYVVGGRVICWWWITCPGKVGRI